MLTFIHSVHKGLDLVLSLACAVLMASLVICVSWQVISRYILTQPSTMTDELARFILIWLVLIAAALCSGLRKHLAIDLIAEAMTEKAKKWLDFYADIVVLGFAFWVMLIGGLRMVDTAVATGEISPAMEMPMSWLYVILPICGAIISIYCLLSLAEALLTSIRQPADLSISQPSGKE